MTLTTLGELAEFVMGQAPPGEACNDDGRGTPFVKAGEFGERRPIIREWTTRPLQMARETDILVCVVGATSGKVNLGADCAIGRSVAAVRPILERLDQRFAYHFLRDQTLRLRNGSQGSAQGVLTRGMLENLRIPSLPVAEQRRIADILDKADAVRRKRKEAIALTEELLRSAFLEMFGDPVTNPKGWDVKPLANLGLVTTGNTPSRAVLEYFGDYIEWIKSDNINTSGHFLTRATEGLSAQGRAISRTAPAGSTLMTCIAGSPDCIGNVALADREVAFNQQINAVTPRGGVDHRFLYVMLLIGKRLVQAASTNSMKGMVSKGKLEQVVVPFPPTGAQAQPRFRAFRLVSV